MTKDIRVGGAGTNSEVHKVKFEVTQDIILNGYVIAKAGDLAEGEYTNQNNVTKRVFSTNESQEVALDIDDIVNFSVGTPFTCSSSERSSAVRAGGSCRLVYTRTTPSLLKGRS